MPHTNTVFRDVLKLLPWSAFERLVEKHGTDDLVRSFTTKRQLLALLFGQLSGAHSLRDIEASMSSHQARLYHAGGAAPARSTFADANRDRDSRVFSGLFMHMLGMATRGLRRKMGDAVRLIDSTSLRLAGAGAEWARFSAEVCGAKAHVVYDPDLGRPIYHMVTEATVNDIVAAKTMPIEAGATYVFDLGYYDYGWWAALDEADCRIVTRFKKNTPLNSARSMPVEPGTGVVSDRIGFLPGRQAKSRKNPMQGAVREIVVTMETGEHLAHLLQRSGRAREGNRRPLQAALADRIVLPRDETDLENHPFHRPLRERRAHSDRRRADRLSPAEPAAQDGARPTILARDHSNSCAPTSCIARTLPA